MRQIVGEIVGVEDRVVTGALRMKDPRSRECRLAVMVDQVFAGSIGITLAGKSRAAGFRFELPNHTIPSTLDVLDIATGESVLAAPFSLREMADLRVELFVLEGHVVSGRFSLRQERDCILPVALLAEGQPPIETLAVRVPQARSGTGRFVYEFRAPLATLCPLDRSYALTPRIGGCILPDGPVLPVDAHGIGYVGYVDRQDNGMISGWAADLTDKTRRLKLDLVRDGRIIAVAVADQLREDLAAAGISDGKCAFSFSVPHVGRDEPDAIYSVFLSGTTTHVSNSPARLGPSLRLIGYFDEIQGGIAVGWICDLDNPTVPLEIEIVCGTTVLARVVANGYRGDVQRAGVPNPNCGFRVSLGARFRENLGREVFVRPIGIPVILNGSPKVLTENPNIGRFLDRSRRLDEAKLLRLRRTLNHRAGQRGISIVMPIHNTDRAWLLEAIESVRNQWCDNWELICVDDFSTEPHIGPILAAYARHDPRFRVLRTHQNVGIARATNFGIRAARHEYITFMDHDDFLEPDAIYCLLRAIETTGAEFLYSDEVLTHDELTSIMEVRARPSFSYDYYLSHPYFVHLLCVKTEVAQRVGGWDEQLPISADVDFVLRVLEVANAVAHVPAVLYRWRTHSGSTGHARQTQVMAATKGALRRHLARRGLAAEVSDGVFFNQFRIDWPRDSGEILIVIPTRNKGELLRTCIDSIERTSGGVNYRIVVIDHQSDQPESRRILKKIAARHTVMAYEGSFNYAAMNNLAVREHAGRAKYILFCNNDIEAIEPGWLDRLRSLANRSDVGAVGPLLLYGDKRVQHAGVIIGFNNAAEHAMKFVDAYIDGGERRNLGYNCSLSSVRDFSAVTAACMMLKREVFEEVGGFDEIFAIGFNDTDLCLRIIRAGYKILYDGHTMLYHYESATRSETRQVLHPKDDGLLRRRWRRYFVEGDPFYNPNLDLRMNDHTLRTDAGCRGLAAPRLTPLAGTSRPRRRKRIEAPVRDDAVAAVS